MTKRAQNHCALALVSIALLGVAASPAWATILLDWDYVKNQGGVFVRDPVPPTSYATNSTVNIGLFVKPNTPTTQVLGGLELIFQWEDSLLKLLNHNDAGGAAASFYLSAFLDDTWGINEAFPPQDGDGIYTGFATSDVSVPPAGVLITTFQFKALQYLGSRVTEVAMLAGLNGGVTSIKHGFDDVLGGLDAPIPVAAPEPVTGLALLAAAPVLLRLRRRHGR